jgi:hypothetical protein
MSPEAQETKKERVMWMEKQLRLDGQKLDEMWTKARNAVGQERIELHKQIGPLREKQRLAREEHETLKKT